VRRAVLVFAAVTATILLTLATLGAVVDVDLRCHEIPDGYYHGQSGELYCDT
jgi:hypothetical protein